MVSLDKQIFGVSYSSSKWCWIYENLCCCNTGEEKVISHHKCVLSVSTEGSSLAPLLGTLLASDMKPVVGATCSLFSLIWLLSGSPCHCPTPNILAVTPIQLSTWTLSYTRPLHLCSSETYLVSSATLLGKAKCCSKQSQNLSG